MRFLFFFLFFSFFGMFCSFVRLSRHPNDSLTFSPTDSFRFSFFPLRVLFCTPMRFSSIRPYARIRHGLNPYKSHPDDSEPLEIADVEIAEISVYRAVGFASPGHEACPPIRSTPGTYPGSGLRGSKVSENFRKITNFSLKVFIDTSAEADNIF